MLLRKCFPRRVGGKLLQVTSERAKVDHSLPPDGDLVSRFLPEDLADGEGVNSFNLVGPSDRNPQNELPSFEID